MFTFELMEDFEVVNQFVDPFTAITSCKNGACIPPSRADSLDVDCVTDVTSKLDLQTAPYLSLP